MFCSILFFSNCHALEIGAEVILKNTSPRTAFNAFTNVLCDFTCCDRQFIGSCVVVTMLAFYLNSSGISSYNNEISNAFSST